MNIDDSPRHRALRELAADVGQAIGVAMPPGVGFTFVVFDVGKPLGTFMSYASNISRDDVPALLDELSSMLKGMRDS